MKILPVLGLAFGIVGSAMLACATVDQSNLGDFNSLQGREVPQRPTGSSGGTGTCKEFATQIDQACAVKFKTDILPALVASGGMRCAGDTAGGCHSVAGGIAPVFTPDNPETTYDALTKKNVAGKPYVNCASKNPDDSSIVCNLDTTIPTACGSRRMPDSPGTPAPPEFIASLKTWLACGAPLN